MGKPTSDPAAIDAANRYHSYYRGFQHGASTKAKAPEFASHTDEGIRQAYLLGYQEGYDALHKAVKAAEERYGYIPSILRTQPVSV